MKISKLIACLMLAVAAIGLSGCAGGADTATPESSATSGDGSGTQPNAAAADGSAKKEGSGSK